MVRVGGVDLVIFDILMLCKMGLQVVCEFVGFGVCVLMFLMYDNE